MPVEILRDTGTTQSLLVEGILPLLDTMATGSTSVHQAWSYEWTTTYSLP